MDVLDSTPGVSPDRNEVAFRLSGRMSGAECAITRQALEDHFWLPRGADAHRMLKTFIDGQKRIAAIAERKSLTQPGQPIRLSSGDFAAKR
ncbi:DUF1488 family protein [Paraburkholderia phenazinium]|uniref:DUF1488 family protein n=1 Tax=Paraburkholderia phenazinium TaxID=60549 RepID=UPI0015890232|nr:DUF1488 family protein [Paraburkholderia phenazinium]